MGGKNTAENILMVGGAVVLISGALILLVGISNNNPNSVGTGAVTFLVGVAILSIAKKFF